MNETTKIVLPKNKPAAAKAPEPAPIPAAPAAAAPHLLYNIKVFIHEWGPELFCVRQIKGQAPEFCRYRGTNKEASPEVLLNAMPKMVASLKWAPYERK